MMTPEKMKTLLSLRRNIRCAKNYVERHDTDQAALHLREASVKVDELIVNWPEPTPYRRRLHPDIVSALAVALIWAAIVGAAIYGQRNAERRAATYSVTIHATTIPTHA